ncbi:hypothetical protein CKO11_04725 [Rhodobacter sp. TJ_12]|nr:hypothetical protein [Rhodobacter sp. TJ_12]
MFATAPKKAAAPETTAAKAAAAKTAAVGGLSPVTAASAAKAFSEHPALLSMRCAGAAGPRAHLSCSQRGRR